MAALAFAPVLSMKLANARIKAIMAEAEKNPIETMIAIDIVRSKELAERDQNLEAERSTTVSLLASIDSSSPEKALSFTSTAQPPDKGERQRRKPPSLMRGTIRLFR